MHREQLLQVGAKFDLAKVKVDYKQAFVCDSWILLWYTIPLLAFLAEKQQYAVLHLKYNINFSTII